MKALDRVSRRRRERRNQTQPDHPFAVEACEYLTDGAFALLRVSGTGSAAPVALVTQGDKPQSFDPLPQPDPGRHNGVWGIAFALPAELAEPGMRLWLHDGGVYLADLLVPPPAGAAPAAPEPAAVEAKHQSETQPEDEDEVAPDDPRARKLVEAWSDAATLREKLADREAELAEALKELLAARNDVQPLRDRAEELTEELADASAELELVHKHGREARLRATEKAAELDTVRAELAAMQPEALEGRIADLRQQVELLEQKLADAEVERTRLAALAEVEKTRLADELESERTRADSLQSRRRGFGRRSDDRAVEKARAELEAQVAEREQRIEQLEKEAESFASRREVAVSESVQERLAELEEEIREHVTCNEDLRSLLDSERETTAASRREVHELRQQLATATANAKAEAQAVVPVVPAASDELAVRRAPIEPPPWSALDDELLARIEKAKALTG